MQAFFPDISSYLFKNQPGIQKPAFTILNLLIKIFITPKMRLLALLSICVFLLPGSNTLLAQSVTKENKPTASKLEGPVPVTWANFVRAESDKTFQNYVGLGGFGKFFHFRAVTPIDKQDVTRLNRDTRYSIGVFDLTNPLTITLPDTKGRFISLQVINEDEYTKSVEYNAGDYTLTREGVGTRYVCLIIRILVNGGDEKDHENVTGLQNTIAVKQSSIGTFEIPAWDQTSLDKLRDAINVLASTLTDTKLCYGDEDEVDPIAHMLGAAYGWGGNPQKDAMYINVVPEQNDGKTPFKLTVKDVPVDGFWSVSVYNKAGYFEKNPYNSYTVNSASAGKNGDGSITVHFGGDPKQTNFVPITVGWNYIVRLYRARNEVINGSWAFPDPVKGN